MFNFNSLQKAIKFPEAVKRKIASSLVRPHTYGTFPEQSHVARDWDNLVLLDACRYDTFVRNNPFEQPVERASSNASHTTDFLENNLTGDQSDTVYVTASPQVTKYESRFHDVIHVWKDGWDDELRTVPPQNVTEAATNAMEKYQNKKLVIHYMQPHYPFIGPKGLELETHATFTGGLQKRNHLSVWEMLSSGKLSKSDVETAYEENLEIALAQLVKLSQQLEGKTVVTSDHGNLFGEQVSPLPIKLYGHPPKIPAENLITVPLLELPFQKRRTTKSSEKNGVKDKHGNLESRLEDLGYV